jgi:VIT1/CCC1 family predicted Fe2+/Mn2+ transporter
MADRDDRNWVRRALDPISRLSEIMFGLLMTLTFTGTMSVSLGDGQTVNSILFAALGCNIAWGIVDAVMRLLTTAAENAKQRALVDRLRVGGTGERVAVARGVLPGNAGEQISEAEALTVAALIERSGPGEARLTREDFVAAAAVFVLVVLSTFPPVVPFIVMDDVWASMRVSNAIALVMLFAIGLGFDRYVDGGSRVMRWTVPLVGAALVASTIALGG